MRVLVTHYPLRGFDAIHVASALDLRDETGVVLNHISDGERTFLFRAFWFARSFDTPLPSFEQDVSSAAARADDISWKSHVSEFRDIRGGTLAFFRNLPAEACDRRGTASGNPFTVRALAYIVAGHLAHHRAILDERYL